MKKQYRFDMIETVAVALCCPDGGSYGDRPCLRDTHRTQAWDVMREAAETLNQHGLVNVAIEAETLADRLEREANPPPAPAARRRPMKHDPKTVEMVARANRRTNPRCGLLTEKEMALPCCPACNCWDGATAALDALAADGWQRVPEGWVVVQKEPRDSGEQT